MTKDEWKRTYDILDMICSDFIRNYEGYKNGRNKKIKKECQIQVESLIQSAETNIFKNREIYDLLTDGSHYVYDEFKQPRNFKSGLSDLLIKIRQKIDTIND